jgi:hypothetical protein
MRCSKADTERRFKRVFKKTIKIHPQREGVVDPTLEKELDDEMETLLFEDGPKVMSSKDEVSSKALDQLLERLAERLKTRSMELQTNMKELREILIKESKTNPLLREMGII